ncbi:phage major capsid protein, HK97 family [Salinibacillus kushneri]|uniref:Phage major capsid protein, HK97 family n=1 Tax=Salinibacillus kushneri TaxID=237682 RepID=A0A1I0B5R5_9BACI|nr:phage major capsid protein [Salinibacillus kushneri]SET02067.1 phage major capsid protein, HK97 family [Salinibacillus kushneri]
MPLKKLMIQKKIDQRKASLNELLKRDDEFATRSAELEESINEAKTEEEVSTVESSIEELENEKQEHDDKKSKLEGEISELEEELEELNSNEPSNPKRTNNQKGETRDMNRLQVRELLKTGEYYERSEVKEFYDNFKNLRAVSGGELTIPDVVVNRIMDIMGDYTTLYPLVDKIQVKGTTRILVDADTSAATWMEQSSALPQGDVGTITDVDFDGFKVGKVTFVDNYLLQDSIINLDSYVTRKIARAIAKALDKAIVNGTGSGDKQPAGVIPNLPSENNVGVTADEDLLKNLVKQIGLIDTGDDSVGEIVAVMNRKTYYNRLFEFSVQVDSSGNVVGKLPNLSQPDLLGLRVVFNNNLEEDEVLFGEFQQYTLVERENITIDSSQHARFTEDQTAFRGKGRFDGKPVKPSAFALATITDPAA